MATALVFIAATDLHAQCPDGSPPPCARAALRTPAPTSVAVLYFESRSRDTADVYLADGLTEAITNQLGHLERLQVKSQTAARRFRGRAVDDPSAVSRALGVTNFVSGSVQRAGSRLHVTVELVRGATGLRLWGEQYDRSDSDVLQIQEDIARAVATNIAGRLLPQEQRAIATRPTRNPKAYDHVLRGNYYLAQRTQQGVARAIAQYDAALRLDPGFTAARAQIALAFGNLLDWELPYENLPADSLLQRGLTAADRALRQDSSSSDAWLARGALLRLGNPGAIDVAREALERAIELDPRNADALDRYASLLEYLGDTAAARVARHRALDIDPERAFTLANLGMESYHARRYEEAARWFDSALVIDPTAWYAYSPRVRVRLLLGDFDGARADVQATLHFAPGYAAEVASALVEARTGDTVAARAHLERLLREIPALPDSEPAGIPARQGSLVAMVFVALGDSSGALDVLERVRPRASLLWFYLRSPELDRIRSNPRFARLVEESEATGRRR